MRCFIDVKDNIVVNILYVYFEVPEAYKELTEVELDNNYIVGDTLQIEFKNDTPTV